MLDMLGMFAEFETNLRREQQLEGIANAKLRGVYKGRSPTIEGNVLSFLNCMNGPNRRVTWQVKSNDENF
jgi:DNA invertase Pin-like site-specific DNA recombinase